MTENGPIMYKVRPLYDFNPTILLPTCMYKMNNVYEDQKIALESPSEDNCDLLQLEKSQLNILQKLEDLKAKVIQLKEDLGVTSVISNIGQFQDIVIKANPQYPPLSIWVFYNLLSQSFPTRLVTHLHSSLAKVPEKVQQLQNFSTSQNSNISLTIIWRGGEKDHEMMISPVQQGIIEGEVNIARYLSRLLSCNYDSDAVTSTLIDDWLEMAHSVIHGSNKDRQDALRLLNTHFGKNTFLVGDKLTVADIVMWSALIQTNGHASAPANVTNWFKSLLKMDTFNTCNRFA